MRRIRTVSVAPKKPPFSKRAIEQQTQFYVSFLGDRSERRDIAAEVCDVSRRTIDAWCSSSDPRIISADNLFLLAMAAHERQKAIMDADKIYRVTGGFGNTDIIGEYRHLGIAQFVADTCGHSVFRIDDRPVQLTEQQQLRSKLRKIYMSGKIQKWELVHMFARDEYELVLTMVELRKNSDIEIRDWRIDRVEREIRMGEAA